MHFPLAAVAKVRSERVEGKRKGDTSGRGACAAYRLPLYCLAITSNSPRVCHECAVTPRPAHTHINACVRQRGSTGAIQSVTGCSNRTGQQRGHMSTTHIMHGRETQGGSLLPPPPSHIHAHTHARTRTYTDPPTCTAYDKNPDNDSNTHLHERVDVDGCRQRAPGLLWSEGFAVLGPAAGRHGRQSHRQHDDSDGLQQHQLA